MRYYPVNLDLQGRSAVVVGGGAVAARKAGRLVSAGASVTVVAPRLDSALAELAATGAITHVKRSYRAGDLAGAFLAFAASDDTAVNLAVAAEAKERAVLIDVVDAPSASTFTTPALLERGELLVTVSTGGASPALSRRLIKELEGIIGGEYAEAVALLSTLREKILTVKGTNAYNVRVFAELAADLPALIRNGQRDAIDRLLLKYSSCGSAPGRDGADSKKDPS